VRAFEISESKWLRGEGSKNSFLFRGKDRKMCCVGQIANQLGVPKARLLGKRGITCNESMECSSLSYVGYESLQLELRHLAVMRDGLYYINDDEDFAGNAQERINEINRFLEQEHASFRMTLVD